MKTISNDDVYADALSNAALATIPFITFGILKYPTLLNIAAALGILLGCAFLIRFVMMLYRPEIIRTKGWIEQFMSLLQLPYVFAISATILIFYGMDASVVLWICLAFSLMAAAWSIYDFNHPD